MIIPPAQTNDTLFTSNPNTSYCPVLLNVSTFPFTSRYLCFERLTEFTLFSFLTPQSISFGPLHLVFFKDPATLFQSPPFPFKA